MFHLNGIIDTFRVRSVTKADQKLFIVCQSLCARSGH